MRRFSVSAGLVFTLLFSAATGLPMAAFSQDAKPAKDDQPTAQVSGNGELEVLIKYVGAVPKNRVADDTGVHRELLRIDARTGGVRDAVVSLRLPEAKPSEKSPSELKDAAKAVERPALVIDQKDYAFTPRVSAVRAGQLVRFTNNDPANHNVRSASLVEKNQFNVLTTPSEGYEHRVLADPKERPILVGCDIHPWMNAWIYVFDHPHFALSNERGTAILGNLPPGAYRLLVRQPDAGFNVEREVQVVARQRTQVEVKFAERDLRLR